MHEYKSYLETLRRLDCIIYMELVSFVSLYAGAKAEETAISMLGTISRIAINDSKLLYSKVCETVGRANTTFASQDPPIAGIPDDSIDTLVDDIMRDRPRFA